MLFNPWNHFTPDEDLDVLRGLSERVATVGRGDALEVGTWMGGSALVLAESFRSVFCVDNWCGNRDDPGDPLGQHASAMQHTPEFWFKQFCSNMGSKLYYKIVPCFGSSELYASVWSRKLSLIFLDGDHRYEAVKADIAAWMPHVAPGGILCGHDYSSQFPGVVQAVNEAFGPDHFAWRNRVWWHQV